MRRVLGLINLGAIVVALAFGAGRAPAQAADVICYNCPPQWGDFATMPAPMVPPAPARLSTTTDWPSRAARFCASGRPTRSVVPPAANGTTKVIGLVGHSCAAAKLPQSIERAQARPAIFSLCVNTNSSDR